MELTFLHNSTVQDKKKYLKIVLAESYYVKVKILKLSFNTLDLTYLLKQK